MNYKLIVSISVLLSATIINFSKAQGNDGVCSSKKSAKPSTQANAIQVPKKRTKIVAKKVYDPDMISYPNAGMYTSSVPVKGGYRTIYVRVEVDENEETGDIKKSKDKCSGCSVQ